MQEKKIFPLMLGIYHPHPPLYAHNYHPPLPAKRPWPFVPWYGLVSLHCAERGKDIPSYNMLDVLRVHGYITPYFLIQLTVCLEI